MRAECDLGGGASDPGGWMQLTVAENIEDGKVDGQSAYKLTSVVEDDLARSNVAQGVIRLMARVTTHLGVEGDCPGEEVCPANDGAEDV